MGGVDPEQAAPYLLFAGLACTLGVVHALAGGAVGAGTDVAALVPVALSMGIVYAGYRFQELDPSGRQLVIATGLLLGGGLYGAGFVAFIEWLQSVDGTPPALTSYPVLLAGAGGTTMATVIAHYYVAYASRVQEARSESERARQLQEQVGVLNRALRHNIRNELTVINGWLEIAFEERDTDGEYDRIRTHLQKLEELSETARRVQEVLQSDRTVRMDAVDQVDSVLDRIDAESTTVATETPDSAAVAAHPQLDAAIEEAIRNALQHNDPSDLRIDVTVTPVRQNGSGVAEWGIEIVDNGDGIPEVEREVLAATENTQLTHGQGLGLYLIKSILKQSEGRLTFEEGPEAGTTVRLVVPAV